MPTMPFELGDVVLVPFPFTSQTATKKRPAVIVKELAIGIPYPRSSKTRFLPEFTELERQAGVALGIVHQ